MNIEIELITLAGVLATCVTAIIVALINLRQNRRIQEIHVLVNDRLEQALAKIEELKTELRLEQARNGV